MHSHRTDARPCPHCQNPVPWIIEEGDNPILGINPSFHVKCGTCTKATGPHDTKHRAIADWNGDCDYQSPRLIRLLKSARIIEQNKYRTGHEEFRELKRVLALFEEDSPEDEL